MELFIGPKILLPRDIIDLIDFLDLDHIELLNAVLNDMKVFERDVYSSLVERAINRTFSVWHGAQYDAADAHVKAAELEKLLKQWFFLTIPEDILTYFYCRTFVRMENSTEPNFSIFYLKMDALYDEIYRSNPSHIRESLHGLRTGFLNR